MELRNYDITHNDIVIPCQNWETGTGMAGYKWIATDERAILLYQHAFGDYTQRFVQDRSRFFPHLLARGVSVYGIDMPGCGRSPGNRGAVDPHVATRHHLTARALLADACVPVFLAGHSLGGLVTATSLLRDQSNVAGAILISSALKYGYSRPIRWLATMGGYLVPTRAIPVRNGPIEMLTRDPHEQQKLINDPMLDVRGITWLTAKGTLGLSLANWKHYSLITVPMLALHGTYDTATNARGSVELIETVSSEDKTLHLVQGGRHDLFDDLVSDETRDTIIDWITARVRPSRQNPPS